VNPVHLAYTPFIDPLPIWSPDWMWIVLLIPLCAAVAIVYKTIKCGAIRHVPREALVLFITIIAGLVMAAAALAGIVKLME
jgi:hypothetical protein